MRDFIRITLIRDVYHRGPECPCILTALEGIPSTKISLLSFFIDSSTSAAVLGLEDGFSILLNECAVDELADEDGGIEVPQTMWLQQLEACINPTWSNMHRAPTRYPTSNPDHHLQPHAFANE